MRRCSIFVTLLKNEYIEVEFNKARCFCSFRCLSNPHSCTITSLIFRTQGIRALLSVRKFLRVQVSVRIVPCATFLVRSLPCAYFRAQISSCASFRIPSIFEQLQVLCRLFFVKEEKKKEKKTLSLLSCYETKMFTNFMVIYAT